MKKGLVASAVLAVCVLLSIYTGHVQKREDRYTERSNDLAKIWHSASEFYGYWDQIGGTEHWDESFPMFQERLWNCQDEYDYYVLLEEMLAGLKDGHAQITAGVYGPQWVNELNIPGGEEIQELKLGVLPFQLAYIDGKYFISKRTANCPVPMFSEITGINGLETGQYLEENISARTGLQTEQARERAMAEKLRVSRYGDKIKLSYRAPDGSADTVKFKYGRILQKQAEWESAELTIPGELLYDGQYLDIYEVNRLCYVRIFSIDAETAAEEFWNQAVPLLPGTDGLIMDLRYCGGGNVANGTRILRMLRGDSVRQMQRTESLRNGFEMRVARQTGYGVNSQSDSDSELMERGRAMLNGTYYYNPLSPDLYSESISNQIMKELGEEESAEENPSFPETSPQPYDKPCVMLIGPGTVSAGESMAILAQDAGIPLIGSHTAGIEGDLILERLSNGWVVGFSSGNSYGPGGELIWNRGVYPDLNHEISPEDWMAGNDTALSAAMEYMNLD